MSSPAHADDESPWLQEHHLSIEEVDEIIASAAGEKAIIVGGQALNIWAELLLSEEQQDQLQGPMTSKDMDYFGNIDLAEALADRLDGEVILPNLKDAGTPQAAIVVLERRGRKIQIDIMSMLSGLTNKEVSEDYVEVFYDTAGGEEIELQILSPLHILKARVSSVMTLKRRDKNTIRQLRVAPMVLVAFIKHRIKYASERADKAILREAQSMIRAMISLGGSPDMDQIYLAYGVDLLEHAESLEDEDWDERFRERQIIGAISKARLKRNTRISERERRLPGFKQSPFGV